MCSADKLTNVADTPIIVIIMIMIADYSNLITLIIKTAVFMELFSSVFHKL